MNLHQVKTRLKQSIKKLTRAHLEIEEIWLFGSLAREDAVPGSDADLLIILSESLLPFLERSVYYQPESLGIGVDVLVYTREEIGIMKGEGNFFVENALAEGVCLFRRTSNRNQSV